LHRTLRAAAPEITQAVRFPAAALPLARLHAKLFEASISPPKMNRLIHALAPFEVPPFKLMCERLLIF
jgi:hypothetical protein